MRSSRHKVTLSERFRVRSSRRDLSTLTSVVSLLADSCSTPEATLSSADCNTALAAPALAFGVNASNIGLFRRFGSSLLDEATELSRVVLEVMWLGEADLVDFGLDRLKPNRGGERGSHGVWSNLGGGDIL